MRRLAVLLAVLAAAIATTALLAGCGDDEGSSGSGLDEALSFLPENAPFAIVINTDPDSEQFKNLDQILDKFPFSDQLRKQLQSSLASDDVDYEDDIEPLLGNPFVVGVTDPRDAVSSGSSESFVGAIQVEDKDKAVELIKRDAREAGEASGATIYESSGGGSITAVKDDVIVFANDRPRLEAALEQSENDNSLDEDKFNEALGDLPEEALLRFYADLEAILKADPDTQDALKVKWVAALRKLGLTASVESDAVKIDFDLNTEPDGLTDEDLPLATGEESPSVVKRAGEISIGLRDASRIAEFAQQAAQAVDPEGFGQFVTAKRQLNQRLGVDIDRDIVDQFDGEVAVNVDSQGGFGLRAQPKDPQAMEDTLAKVADRLPAAARRLGIGAIGIAKPGGGEDFYGVALPDGKRFVMGVVNDVFVVSNDAQRAGQLATAEPEKVDGAKGSLVAFANAEELVGRALGDRLEGLQALGAGLATRPLGDLTQWLEADTSGLRGTARLGID